MINKCQCTCEECGDECNPYWKERANAPSSEPMVIDGIDVSRCEFSTIRSNELKCLADDKDVHTCLGTKEKTKCPIYRLKIQLQNKTAECEELKKQLARYKLYEDMEDFISKHSEDTDEHLSYQLFQTESKLQTAKQALEPFEDEYFKGLNTTQIAELAKKSIRLTTYNRDLECALDEIEDIIAKIDAD